MVDSELAELSRRFPLPRGWSAPELFADTIDVGEAVIRRAGVQATGGAGREATGSAAAMGASPLPRAWFELLERVAVLDASARAGAPGATEGPARSRPSLSNGVALQRSWPAACRAASLELLERDRVLRAWLGELALEEVDVSGLARRIPSHRWRAALIAPGSGDAEVAVVIGFPRGDALPLTRGFAARPSAGAAVEAAVAEAVQCLAFLWGEEIPDRAPELAATPMFHLDHYLYPPHHETLQGWLDGAHLRHEVRTSQPPARVASMTFDDIAPRDWPSSLAVCRAKSAEALELVFGEPPPAWAAKLPPELHVHPIP